MEHHPDCNSIELRSGSSRCVVADPRGGADQLGARYVHGGYVLDLYEEDQCLTANSAGHWDPYIGRGLPEVFETGLGYSRCSVGECFMRIGAGQVRRTEASDSFSAKGPLEKALDWTVDRVDESTLRMGCRDRLVIGGKEFAYRLVRELRLENGRLISRTELTLQVPWCEPLLWFAHPFIAQNRGDGIGIELASGIEPADAQLTQDSSKLYRFGSNGGFSVLRGAWGSLEPFRLNLEDGRAIRVRLSRPLEKLVAFATPSALSVEPYFSRGWMDGETADWEVSYCW